MPNEIDERKLHEDSEYIVRAAEHGESFIITREGSPIASIGPPGRATFVSAEAMEEGAKRLPDIDWDEFQADIDEYVDQDPSWGAFGA